MQIYVFSEGNSLHISIHSFHLPFLHLHSLIVDLAWIFLISRVEFALISVI